MSYKQFVANVESRGWTIAQLRCDVPPTQEILDFIDEVGLVYERFVGWYCKGMRCVS